MPHRYVSTACLHEEADRDPSLHEACRETCKFCDSPCCRPRHHPGEVPAAPPAGWVDQARDIARELYGHLAAGDPFPVGLAARIEADPGLFWLRGGEQPPGTWRPEVLKVPAEGGDSDDAPPDGTYLIES